MSISLHELTQAELIESCMDLTDQVDDLREKLEGMRRSRNEYYEAYGVQRSEVVRLRTALERIGREPCGVCDRIAREALLPSAVNQS